MEPPGLRDRRPGLPRQGSPGFGAQGKAKIVRGEGPKQGASPSDPTRTRGNVAGTAVKRHQDARQPVSGRARGKRPKVGDRELGASRKILTGNQRGVVGATAPATPGLPGGRGDAGRLKPGGRKPQRSPRPGNRPSWPGGGRRSRGFRERPQARIMLPNQAKKGKASGARRGGNRD